jgi:hypothetical protein
VLKQVVHVDTNYEGSTTVLLTASQIKLVMAFRRKIKKKCLSLKLAFTVSNLKRMEDNCSFTLNQNSTNLKHQSLKIIIQNKLFGA